MSNKKLVEKFCPLIDECSEDVSEKHFKVYCIGDFKSCLTYMQKFLHTPSEWIKKQYIIETKLDKENKEDDKYEIC